MQNDFRKPRNALLNVVAEFMSKCVTRYHDLCKKIGQDSKSSDLMDSKCHMVIVHYSFLVILLIHRYNNVFTVRQGTSQVILFAETGRRRSQLTQNISLRSNYNGL